MSKDIEQALGTDLITSEAERKQAIKDRDQARRERDECMQALLAEREVTRQLSQRLTDVSVEIETQKSRGGILVSPTPILRIIEGKAKQRRG